MPVAIQLGVTWSETLASSPTLLESLDFVELPGWQLDPASAPPHRRILLHNLDFDWSLASTAALGSDWARRLRSALEWTGSAWFSVHLGFASERVRFANHMLPVSEPLARELLLERVVSNLLKARQRCPVPLAIENLDYCPEGAYEHVCEPDFINAVVDASGCELLLDLGHLQVSASWLGVDPFVMLAQFPLERVREIHLSSPRPLAPGEGRLDDVHERLIERDFMLLECALERASPSAVTLEYKRELVALEEQVEAVRSRFVN